MNNRQEYLKKYRLEHKEKYREYQIKYRKNHLSTYEKLQQEIKKLQQENEKLYHYKTLYQSLKKQKEELRDYLKARIEVCDNRLSSPFCNIEKATKEKLILSQCLEKMEELEQPKKELLKPSHYDEEIDVEYELEKARKFIQEDKKRKFERNSNE